MAWGRRLFCGAMTAKIKVNADKDDGGGDGDGDDDSRAMPLAITTLKAMAQRRVVVTSVVAVVLAAVILERTGYD